MSTKLPTFQELESKMISFNLANYQAIICKNIKKKRKELFENNKNYYKLNNITNPYSAQSISELLGISYEYYKRLESFDKSKPISLKLLLKVADLFDMNINDFFQ